ncbi:MAG: hypothetical protein HYX57_04135 [Chloroflexi bacterium]|nr:hypothetical protein [Chloroflexota bacterium]
MTTGRRLGRPSLESVGLALLFGFAIVVGTELARPLRSASIAFDSQVAVLDFERIVAGRQIEAFLPTTPKPLLTVIFGLLHAVSGGWAAIAWATIGAYALSVVLAAVLAARLAGRIAAAFSAVAVLLSPSLLFDVGFALATPWAALGWFSAGLALTARRPRYGLAGVALLMATLARLETIVPVGFALVVLAAGSVVAARRGAVALRPARKLWITPLVALLALPVMMLHDALLTGDPFFWTTVAGRYSAATSLEVMGPAEVVTFLIGRYWIAGAVTLLALLGILRLIRERRWALVTALVGFGPGIGAFLVLLAARGIFVSERYAAGIDVAVAFASGLGLAGIAVDSKRAMPSGLLRGLGSRLSTPVMGVLATAMVAVLVVGPYWLVDPGLRSAVSRSGRLAANEERAVAVLATALQAADGARGSAGAGGLAAAVLVFAPTPIRPRLVVDLGLMIPEVAGTDARRLDVANGYPPPGSLVLHSLSGDGPSSMWTELETSERTMIDGVTVEPLLAEPAKGLWILRLVDRPVP